MQVILGRRWGSAEATSEFYEGEGAIEKAKLSREQSPDVYSIWGGSIFWRESPEDVWRWENGTPIKAKYNYNNLSLTKIWERK
jgi:hypothetical protein